MQESKTTQQAGKGKSHPPEKPETPEKNQKHTRTPNREAATRPKKTPNRNSRVSGAKKNGKSQKAGRTGRDEDREAEGRIEPLELVRRPQGLTEIPGPPGTAGISVNPAPEKRSKKRREQKDPKILIVNLVESKSSKSHRDDTHPRPREEARQKEKEADNPRTTRAKI